MKQTTELSGRKTGHETRPKGHHTVQPIAKAPKAGAEDAKEDTAEVKAISSFSDIELHPKLAKRIAELNFTIPTPVQAQAIPAALDGDDILATAQTGTGKTLAFLLPTVELLLDISADGGFQKPAAKPAAGRQGRSGNHASAGAPFALVLVPTRELALQVEKVYRDLTEGYLPRAVVIIGGASEGPQIEALQGGAPLVIATPGRLEDLMDRKFVRLDKIELLVLDEADRMLDMGFVPAIRRIVAKIPRDRQSMCFSATLEASVAHLMSEVLHKPTRIAVGSTDRAHESVKLLAYQVEVSQKTALLERLLREHSGQTLVFVGTRRRAETVARKLQKAGVSNALLHGDRSQSQRVRALDDFSRAKVQVLVATDVASRGIHVDNISHVVNFDLPRIPEDFIHRAGRTGRAGETGTAITFYAPIEARDLAAFERKLGRKLERVAVENAHELESEARPGPVEVKGLKLITRETRNAPAAAQQEQPRRRRSSNGGRRNHSSGRENTTTGGNDSGRVMLEGESLQKYA